MKIRIWMLLGLLYFSFMLTQSFAQYMGDKDHEDMEGECIGLQGLCSYDSSNPAPIPDPCGPDAIIIDGICHATSPDPFNCVGYVFGFVVDECLLLWYVVLAVVLSGIVVAIIRKRK